MCCGCVRVSECRLGNEWAALTVFPFRCPPLWPPLPAPVNVAHKLFNTLPLVAIKNENKKKNLLIGGKCCPPPLPLSPRGDIVPVCRCITASVRRLLLPPSLYLLYTLGNDISPSVPVPSATAPLCRLGAPHHLFA